MWIVVSVTFLLICRLAPIHAADPQVPANYHTGKAFETALTRPFSATWENVDLRTVARRVSAQANVAVLLDRRLDPSREISLVVSEEAPRDVLDKLTASTAATSTAVGNVIYVGPKSAAARVRTLIALREQELYDDSGPVSAKRKLELSRAGTVIWQDLDRPIEIISRLGVQHGLEISGLELVPHDLWAGATLPQAGVTDALALVLVQFDLGFEWTDQANGIRIVPLPEKLTIDRLHAPPRGMTAAAAVSRWREAFPRLQIAAEGKEIRVTGTVEDHEAIERASRPSTTREPSTAKSKNDSLKLKRYTLRFQDNPVTVLMETLEKSPDALLTFEYDIAKLKAAGVDLNRRISFDVKTATIEQLLEAAFSPLGARCELENRTVRIVPKQK